VQVVAVIMFLDAFGRSKGDPDADGGLYDREAENGFAESNAADQQEMVTKNLVRMLKAESLPRPPPKKAGKSTFPAGQPDPYCLTCPLNNIGAGKKPNGAPSSGTNRGRLGQVETGEGKSHVVALLCVALTASMKYGVDMMTSNRVLAEEQWIEWDPFYKIFDIAADSNARDLYEKSPVARHHMYNRVQVVYGEIGAYERDFLLSEYDKQKIRDKLVPASEKMSVEQVVVIDEVDSLTIDNADKSLYISHEVDDLEYCAPVLVRIWEVANELPYDEDLMGMKPWEDETVIQQVTDQILNEIRINRFEMPLGNPLLRQMMLNPLQIKVLVENAFFALSLNESDDYLFPSGAGAQWSQLMAPTSEDLSKELGRAKSSMAGKSWAKVSSTFKERMSTPVALTVNPNDPLKKDAKPERKGSKFDDKVLPMEKDTGQENPSTRWSNGLHQFLQLKHLGKLEPLGLKAYFDSNMGFLKKYAWMFGMTGTLGQRQEKSFLRSIYQVDFFKLPRYDQRRYYQMQSLILDSDAMAAENAKSSSAAENYAMQVLEAQGANGFGGADAMQDYHGLQLSPADQVWVDAIAEDLTFTLQPFAGEILRRKAKHAVVQPDVWDRCEKFGNSRRGRSGCWRLVAASRGEVVDPRRTSRTPHSRRWRRSRRRAC